MTTSQDIPLAQNPIDRAAERRNDGPWLEAALKTPDVLVMLMQNGKPLIEDGQPDRALGVGQAVSPTRKPIVWLGPQAVSLSSKAESVFLGVDKAGAPIFAFDMPEDWSIEDSPIKGLGDFEDMRSAIGGLSPMEANCASTARSLFEWHRNHRFCAKCGSPSEIVEAGWKRVCPACGAEHFPRTDPVAIMLAVKDGHCLLGRGPNWPAGFMSCLAGFVEPGETFEQAAVRELFEEAGIQADPDTAEYLFCQPWPFPSSLMIGILVQATSTDIVLDQNELADARWISREETKALLEGQHDELYAPPDFAVAHHILKHWAYREE